MRIKTWFVSVVAAMGLPLTAGAALPTTSLVDGVLTSTGGSPAADGEYDVAFAIYGEIQGGNAAWSETAKVKVAGGRFTHALGSAKPIDLSKLLPLNGHFLSVKVGSDPELPRQAIHAALTSLVANTALSVTCDGCVGSNHVANGSIAAAKVGFNYAGAATKGGAAADLDCTGCVGVAELSFDGDVDLGGNSLKAKNGTFSGDVTAKNVTAAAFVGDGSKLTGINTPAGECKVAGEVVKGINADGSLKCVAALDPSALPKDGLNEISNDLLSNQFQDTIAGAAGVKIPDNTGAEANATMDFPDIGVSQDFELYVEVANTDLSTLALTVLPPDDKKTGWKLCDPCGKKDEKAYKVTFNSANKPLSGDLLKWIGGNPKGTWNLKAIDTAFCLVQAPGNAAICDVAAKTDGSIVKWHIRIKTLSSKKVNLNGDVYIAGKLWGKDNGHGNDGGALHIANANIKLASDTPTCDAKGVGTMRWDAVYGMQVCDQQYDKAGTLTHGWFVAVPRKVMWSGGCKTHPAGQNGWAAYCLDGVDYTTADDYLTISDAGAGNVTIKKSGVYRFNFFTIQYGCGSKHLRLFINGAQRAYFHNNDVENHNWSSHYADLQWPLRAGDVVQIQAHGDGCNPHRWHHWDTGTAHSRLQIEYTGRWHENKTPTF